MKGIPQSIDFKRILRWKGIPAETLTLIGMTEGTFHPLSFLDQILSAEFLSKNSKLLEVKIDINSVNLTLCQAHCVL